MKKSSTPLGKLADLLASFGLVCIILIFLFLLTLFGTWQQAQDGLYQVQKDYFESWGVVHYLGGIPIPLPGAVPCLALLAINLLVGGLIRIRKTGSTVGVLIIHIGIVVMLAAALVKQTGSDDGRLMLYEGESSDEFVHFYDWEVAIFDATKQVLVDEWIIPHDDLVGLTDGKSRTFTSQENGFEITLSNFVLNGRPMAKGPMWETPYPVVDGYAVKDLGVDPTGERNVACMYAEVNGDQGILYTFDRYPWTFQSGDNIWAVSLRHKRFKMPFKVQLDNFTRELHPNTNMPKVFASDITMTTGSEMNKVEISMNEPLRSDGLVLFQSSWGPQDAKPGEALFSIFSVVRNPSDYWPLYSCIIISIGMLMAFGQKLWRYSKAQSSAHRKALAEKAA